jgi:hypothetical protein
MNNNLPTIHQYFNDRLTELSDLAKRGDPWVFLCASAFIDYLCRLVNGKNCKRKCYITFIEDYLGQIDPRYKKFIYASGDQDLPYQMYYILRCGMVHSFSFVPEKTDKTIGRERSILIAHNLNGDIHFHHHNVDGYDAVVFTAESFVEDLDKLVQYIFTEKALEDEVVASKIVSWWNKHPPIQAISN